MKHYQLCLIVFFNNQYDVKKVIKKTIKNRPIDITLFNQIFCIQYCTKDMLMKKWHLGMGHIVCVHRVWLWWFNFSRNLKWIFKRISHGWTERTATFSDKWTAYLGPCTYLKYLHGLATTRSLTILQQMWPTTLTAYNTGICFKYSRFDKENMTSSHWLPSFISEKRTSRVLRCIVIILHMNHGYLFTKAYLIVVKCTYINNVQYRFSKIPSC